MAGMLNNMANLANAKLAASISSSTSSVTLDDASPFASLGTFYATIMPGDEMSRQSNSEIVQCSYVNGTTLAIVRAQRGTTARSFSAGDILTNGIYTEDINQVQSVGNTVFETAYSSGTYRITSDNSLLPGIPTDGMKITVRINTDSSGTPKLDLQNTGASYNIYTGTLVNNTSAQSTAAVLLAGETYELVFDENVGSGCWKAMGLVQNMEVHSSTEQVVGKWHDGSTIYERTFTGNITSVVANTTRVWTVDSSITYKAAISADGWVQWTSANYSMIGGTTLYDSSKNIIYAGMAVNNGELQIRCCFTQNASSVPYEVSVKYLKAS